MTPQSLIDECRTNGVSIRLDGGALKLKGAPDAVRVAADRLRPHKAELLEYLAANDETWGPFTPYCLPISLELVRELHRLIAQYAALYRLADDETGQIIEAAKRQSAASVPESIAFFKSQLKEKS